MCANPCRSVAVTCIWYRFGVRLLYPYVLLILLYTCAPATCHSNNNFALYNSYRNISNTVNPLRFRDFAPRVTTVENTLDGATNARAATFVEQFAVEERRSARGLHFQADGKDLTIDLEFIIPFVRIPIERSVQVTQTAFRKLVELNAGTLVLGGVVVVVGAAVAGIIKFLSTRSAYVHGYGKKTRAADAASSIMDPFNFVSYAATVNGSAPTKSVSKVTDMLDALDAKLQEHEVNVSACAQRAICGYVQRAVASASAGEGGSPLARILDGLISLDLLKPYLQDTALHNAIELGRKREPDICVLTYAQCKWSNLQNHAWKVMLEYLQHFAGRNG